MPLNIFGDGSAVMTVQIGNDAAAAFPVYPTVYLKSDVKILSGKGTPQSPYEIGF